MIIKKNRRKYKRADIVMPAVFETDRRKINLKNKDFGIAVVKNISAGGVLLKTSTYLPKGVILSLQINLYQMCSSAAFYPADKKSVIHATSRLLSFRKQIDDKYEISVKFVALKREDKKIISEIVKKRLKQAAKR